MLNIINSYFVLIIHLNFFEPYGLFFAWTPFSLFLFGPLLASYLDLFFGLFCLFGFSRVLSLLLFEKSFNFLHIFELQGGA